MIAKTHNLLLPEVITVVRWPDAAKMIDLAAPDIVSAKRKDRHGRGSPRFYQLISMGVISCDLVTADHFRGRP
jgi:hypothetical protein